MSDFYRKLDEAEIRGRAERVIGNRPENLHDYQGCAEQARAAEQHTMCAVCGKDKHTPLRRDDMGGYVCLTCIDKELDERPIPAEQPTQPPAGQSVCKDCGCWIEMGTHCAPCFSRKNPFTHPPAPRCTCGYDARNNERDLDVNCPYHMPAKAAEQPTHLPAGDVVERMCEAARKYYVKSEGMAAALAIAREGMVPKSDYDECVRMLRIESEAAQREGMVSLDDALGPLTDDEREDAYTEGASFGFIQTFLANRRARLAKPAERVTDEQKVEAILTKHFHHIGVVDAAAEIVAALRGKEGK